jgi:MSHA biogenesis protein MshI
VKFPSLKNLLRRDRNHTMLGLEVRFDGIAWAVNAGPSQWQAGFDECAPAQRGRTLKNRLQSLGAGRCHVRTVLPIDQYQVFQIERPPVEGMELAAAARWKLKDLVDFPLDDAVVDVFEFPDNASRGRGALVNAVIARKSLIRDLAELLEAADLELAEVDVAELAMRNLLSGSGQENRSTALVYLRRQYGHMAVCQGQTLYLSRRLDVRTDQLRDPATQEQAVMNLGLEVQRSLDYYESQLGQVPPRQIHVIGHDENLPLGGLLAGALAAEILPLSLGEELGLPLLDPRSLYAVGAARPVREAGA